VIITWQTLRGAIMANIKEFASLRALGVSMGDLRNIVMELSFWVGIAGVLAAGLLTWLVSTCWPTGGVPMSFPPMLIVASPSSWWSSPSCRASCRWAS
jgi:putative ABC transport system permease protein